MVRARAVVGFYRGDLVKPGEILVLSDAEFGELVACQKVVRAPDEKPAVQEKPKDK